MRKKLLAILTPAFILAGFFLPTSTSALSCLQVTFMEGAAQVDLIVRGEVSESTGQDRYAVKVISSWKENVEPELTVYLNSYWGDRLESDTEYLLLLNKTEKGYEFPLCLPRVSREKTVLSELNFSEALAALDSQYQLYSPSSPQLVAAWVSIGILVLVLIAVAVGMLWIAKKKKLKK